LMDPTLNMVLMNENSKKWSQKKYAVVPEHSVNCNFMIL
jgi:hypothetical protein